MAPLPKVSGVHTVTNSDAIYPDLVRGNNQRWIGLAPDAKVYLPTSTAETAMCMAALINARIGSGEVAVRSGGHCYENHVFNSNVRAIIDVSLINTIDYDPLGDYVRVGAGCTLWDVYKTLQRRWGTTIPGGSCATVGAGGHITGGGYGLLSRKYGLTVDYLHGVELVLADGETVKVDRDNLGEWKDLLWAHTGGGGGNFGIVTHFLLRDPHATKKNDPYHLLPAVPTKAFVYDVEIPWKMLGSNGDKLPEVLGKYNDWCERYADLQSGVLSENVFALFRIYPKRDPQGASRAVRLTVQAAFMEGEPGDKPMYKAMELMGAVVPDEKGIRPHSRMEPWLNVTQAIGAGAWEWRGEYKSAYHRKLDGTHIDGMLARFRDHGAEPGANGALVALDTYGGKVNKVGRTDTAEPHRDSIMKLQYQSYWLKPDEDKSHVDWLRDTYTEVYKKTGGLPEAANSDYKTKATDGCFVNYLDAELPKESVGGKPSVWDLYYGKETFARLQAVKKLVDPHDIFHHNQSIPVPK